MAQVMEAEAQRVKEAPVMSAAQEMLFNQLVKQYWAEEEKRVLVHFDNLLVMAQARALQLGVM